MVKNKNFLENQIYECLKNNDIAGSKEANDIIYITFRHLVRWYPQVSNNGKDTYSLNFLEKLYNWEITERAIKAFKNAVKDKKDLSISKLNKIFNKETHPEHNIPVDKMISRLLELQKNSTEQDVIDCLKNDYEVVIISNDESKVLNGSKSKKYLLDGIEKDGKGMGKNCENGVKRLRDIEAKIANDDCKKDLIDYLKKKFKSVEKYYKN